MKRALTALLLFSFGGLGLSHAESCCDDQLTIEYQVDSREFNTLNMAFYKPVLGGFKLYGQADWYSEEMAEDQQDLNEFFYEITGAQKVFGKVHIIAEASDGHEEGDNIIRAGASYDFGDVIIRAFPIASEHASEQVSLLWEFGDRIILSGWVDATFDHPDRPDDDLTVAGDAKLALRLVSHLYPFVELRYDDLMEDTDDEVGVGAGLMVRW